eukprot:GHVR01067511.1.p1 GENE.GHVR01067511.1~~GHVR01067511.1.p1  ORF type:complete len:145 (+),score=13.63 GHVR01067511.1:125-559(+)
MCLVYVTTSETFLRPYFLFIDVMRSLNIICFQLMCFHWCFQHGTTALINACKCLGDLKGVSFLIENGADINHMDKNGKTPVMIAAEDGLPDIVRALFDKQDHLNSKRGIVLTKTQRKKRSQLIIKAQEMKDDYIDIDNYRMEQY